MVYRRTHGVTPPVLHVQSICTASLRRVTNDSIKENIGERTKEYEWYLILAIALCFREWTARTSTVATSDQVGIDSRGRTELHEQEPTRKYRNAEPYGGRLQAKPAGLSAQEQVRMGNYEL